MRTSEMKLRASKITLLATWHRLCLSHVSRSVIEPITRSYSW